MAASRGSEIVGVQATFLSHMVTPTVTEIPRTLSAVSRDTFIGETGPRGLALVQPAVTAPVSLAAIRAAGASRPAPVLRAA